MNDFRYNSCPEKIKIFGFIIWFFGSVTENAYIIQRLYELKATTISASSSDIVNTRTTDYNDDRKFAHYISWRFKKEDKFSGKIVEKVTEFIANYMEADNAYESEKSKKLRFFDNSFNGEAKQFYMTYLQPICTSFS